MATTGKNTTAPTTADPVSADLRQILRTPKLGKPLGTLPERLALARQQQLPHADFLELVLCDEVTAARSTPPCCAPAPPAWTPACAWTPGTVNGGALRPAVRNELTSLRFLDGPHGAWLLGPVGVGKPTWPPRWATSRFAAASGCTCSARTSCSNASRPPASTTASRPRCAAWPTPRC